MATVFSAVLPGCSLARKNASLSIRKSSVQRVAPINKGQVRVFSLFGGGGQQKGGQKQQGGSYYPPIYQPPPGSEITPSQREMLKLGTALRNIGWLSFWSQLILTTVSGVILLFSSGMSSNGVLSINPMDICTLIGVVCGLITTMLSWTWIRAGRRLGFLQDVSLRQCLGTVLVSTNLNLVGLGATILGLQATVGSLVAKTLTTAAGAGYYNGPRAAPPPVAFDVFSVQANANTLMAHFAGLVLANWLLRIVQKHMQKEEDEFAPSAPPMPNY